MLELHIESQELYDEEKEEFLMSPAANLKLEHSLVAIAKWESKYKKSFLHTENKTPDEMLDYIKMMTITPNVKDEVYLGLTSDQIMEIKKYMDDPMTATRFTKKAGGGGGGRIITNELIYCWMAQLRIPYSCEKWHIARLLTLINVCSLENQPPKKMDQKSILRQNAAVNQARRAKMKSKG